MQISNYKVHTNNPNAKYRARSHAHHSGWFFYHDNLGFICEARFCNAFSPSLMEWQPSGITGITGYFGAYAAAHTCLLPPLPLV